MVESPCSAGGLCNARSCWSMQDLLKLLHEADCGRAAPAMCICRASMHAPRALPCCSVLLWLEVFCYVRAASCWVS